MNIMTVAVKVMTMIFLLSIKTAFSLEQTSSCRPYCSGSDCITLIQDRVDFGTAEEACHNMNGELVTFQPETDKNFLDMLSKDLYGNFWIGLRLPAGACSNLSTPLRGYKWTSGSVYKSFPPSLNTWKEHIKVCSPRCVSLSTDQKWAERLCSDRADGFLCRTKHKDACQAQELSDPSVFQSAQGCSAGPCEHTCTDVKGGYKCSCFKGYIPDTKDPRLCKIHCAQQKCPAICERQNECNCPDGYIFSDKFCLDIDECSMEQCDQECNNTFGSFVCYCREGFVLKNEVKCINSTPIVIAKPAANNTTLKGSSAPAGGFLWVWIFLAVAVVVLIFVIRFFVVKRQKHSEQISNQRYNPPEDNNEC